MNIPQPDAEFNGVIATHQRGGVLKFCTVLIGERQPDIGTARCKGVEYAYCRRRVYGLAIGPPPDVLETRFVYHRRRDNVSIVKPHHMFAVARGDGTRGQVKTADTRARHTRAVKRIARDERMSFAKRNVKAWAKLDAPCRYDDRTLKRHLQKAGTQD